MPVFTALMTDAFGAEDPFGELVRNDRSAADADVRILPLWVADRLNAELQSRQIVQ